MTNLGPTDPMFVKVLTVTENIWGEKDYKLQTLVLLTGIRESEEYTRPASVKY